MCVCVCGGGGSCLWKVHIILDIYTTSTSRRLIKLLSSNGIVKNKIKYIYNM